MSRFIYDIGILVRSYRNRKDLKIATVALYMGLSEKYLSDFERGRRPPPKYHILLKIGMFLGIPERDLMWSAAKFYMQPEEIGEVKNE